MRRWKNVRTTQKHCLKWKNSILKVIAVAVFFGLVISTGWLANGEPAAVIPLLLCCIYLVLFCYVNDARCGR